MVLCLEEAAKKVHFLVARPQRPLALPPLRLSVHRNFFPFIKKEKNFFCGFPKCVLINFWSHSMYSADTVDEFKNFTVESAKSAGTQYIGLM